MQISTKITKNEVKFLEIFGEKRKVDLTLKFESPAQKHQDLKGRPVKRSAKFHLPIDQGSTY